MTLKPMGTVAVAIPNEFKYLHEFAATIAGPDTVVPIHGVGIGRCNAVECLELNQCPNNNMENPK